MIIKVFRIKRILTFSLLLFFGISLLTSCEHICRKWKMKSMEVGDKVDSLNGVYVYYNNSVGNVLGRNTTADGYNLGLKYQCVEFVKRYYYEHLDHKMPDSYGHAKDFFVQGVADGKRVKSRNLVQYTNPSSSMPKVKDLLVYDGTTFNKYGHVAIVSKVSDKKIEIIQQNPGASGPSRETYKLIEVAGRWKIEQDKILGWLRKE
ncbi:CHAP domain-containing protein [Aequorivita capsosiphonis]|uniref:CHAP domain-containing protein n=1 Tax=Aequorivita capsosiphonis TaxID=487317 RepID=UPI0005506F1C|nr:CHAP domain-containing protein [Aequorivita capsosiphonis]